MHLTERYEGPVEAIVFAEGAFGETAGKTANGVVAHGTLFDVRAVVDSEKAGRDADDVLGTDLAEPPAVVPSVAAALEEAPDAEALVLGVAPVGGSLPRDWIPGIEAAMDAGCDVVSGLHEFLSDDPEWRERAAAAGVSLIDVRKPPEDDLRVADGRVDDCDADVVLTMGTDCAVGKRTTTFELYRAAREAGLDAGWVATGQTGVMIGADAGVVIDRVPADFVAGVVEDLVCDVAEDRDLVFVEGQAALSHRAYSAVTLGLLHGANPDAVVVADEPGRDSRDDFDRFEVEPLADELSLIEHLSPATVAAVSTWGDADAATAETGLPAGNVYADGGTESLLDAVLEAL
ncbi:DUF1611 domain-containing protein [Haloferax denitrificans]|uniref:DUF1611 domain-containing protein n=1 Tax=Haloferax denitrificans ATCC 35960 TaxID=662478 RepID=M0JAF0_9EURY|nr:DUF1611 domain-containing protein [Haloferax denitrificans]EMA04695.1 hypothetical protein C438_10318 [Haloferax denitrificans ATCC 35960]